MKVLALAALLMILTPESCDQAGMDARAKADQAAAERKLGAGLDPMATRSCSPDQRFERTEVVSTPDASGYSPGHLDTCTGQPCRTWNWAVKTQNGL
jgi:hypothetical protein